jgi:hypothetical protein
MRWIMESGKRPLVFVTGPYSAGTPEQVAANIERALDVGRALFRKGYFPIVPHVLVREYYTPEEHPEFFGYEPLMRYTLAILSRCDIVLCYGSSPGADRECVRAQGLGIPVYFDIEKLPEADKWQAPQQ